LCGKTKSRKPRLVGMLIIEENQVVVAWVLFMLEVALSISLQ
jgi:hypothetical protein